MRVVIKQTLAFRDWTLVFSKAEMDALRKAAAIAEQARDLLRKELGPDAEEHALDVPLAEIEHNWREFEDGEFVIRSEEHPAF